MMRTKQVGWVGGVVLLALSVTACGDDAGGSTDPDAGSEPGRDGGPEDIDGGSGEAVALTGALRGPIGAEVTLRFGDEELAVTVTQTSGSSDDYDATEFSFATKHPAGTDYEVTIAEQPDGLVCAVYKGATGTLPVTADALLVGCEWEFDLVSRNSDDSVLSTFFESMDPVVGGTNEDEGRYVAFVSSAAGFEAASSYRQIYWRDRLTGTTRLVSVTPAGAPASNDSFAPAISGDGMFVAFESYAADLVPSDNNAVRDVFVWSASDMTVERVSVGPADVEADSESFAPSISGDGQVVAFSTGASNLTTGVVGNATINVVRRDLDSETNTLISADINGDGAGGDRAMLSEDGNRLVFWSFASDITAGDTNDLWDIFVYQHDDSSYRRVSLTAGGSERDQGTESTSRVVSPTISGDGRFVAYATTATNVVSGDTNAAQDIFLVELDGSGEVLRVSLNATDGQGDGDSPTGQGERVALSYDGSWVAFTSQATNFGASAGNVFLRNVLTGETRAITDLSSGVGAPCLSRSAAYVTFGAGDVLDARYDSSGLFAHFTSVDRAWWWLD